MKRLFSAVLLTIMCLAAYAQLPSVQVKNIQGKTIDTATLSNDGKPFAICFFASWCKPCNRELKAIHEVYEDWVDETGMKIYAISIDQGQNSQKVKPMVDAEGWEYDVLLDPNSDFLHALGIQMIPHTIIVDGNGKIAEQHSGYQEGGEVQIINDIRKLIADKK
ncbi:MAG: TlpA family protein disulfide reductase [Prevotellaceae bacterium]|nr:TlpA family protein disulfide reductase [Candidatus Minthosoma caballi]